MGSLHVVLVIGLLVSLLCTVVVKSASFLLVVGFLVVRRSVVKILVLSAVVVTDRKLVVGLPVANGFLVE